MNDPIAATLEKHRIDQEDAFALACTCGLHFFPNYLPGGLTWHERHLAVELRAALGIEQPWAKIFNAEDA